MRIVRESAHGGGPTSPEGPHGAELHGFQEIRVDDLVGIRLLGLECSLRGPKTKNQDDEQKGEETDHDDSLAGTDRMEERAHHIFLLTFDTGAVLR
jgi:hypothetical protein